jgi:hypothetical protein
MVIKARSYPAELELQGLRGEGVGGAFFTHFLELNCIA